MVHLVDEIARGKHRVCYHDPADDRYCYKVPQPAAESIRQQRREVTWMTRLARRGYSFSHIAKYDRTAQTNLGTAYRYRLVRDDNGPLSTTVAAAFADPGNHVALRAGLRDLHDHILRFRLAFYDLTANNLLWQKREHHPDRLVLVDGIGDPSGLRFLDQIPAVFHKKVRRRYTRACWKIAALMSPTP